MTNSAEPDGLFTGGGFSTQQVPTLAELTTLARRMMEQKRENDARLIRALNVMVAVHPGGLGHWAGQLGVTEAWLGELLKGEDPVPALFWARVETRCRRYTGLPRVAAAGREGGQDQPADLGL